MAAAFPIPLTAAQIGSYFVGQYYQVLQQQPEIVHQFYSDASTMVRIDSHTRETATAMLQIHSLVMSISYSGVEIKTIYSLESWSGGVIVMISGTVQLKNFSGNRKFMQTFFLAPQETGFFILNDIFHFVEEEQAHHHHHHHPTIFLAQNNLNTKPNSGSTNQDSVPYMLRREIPASEFAPAELKENGSADKFNVLPERPQHQVSEPEKAHESSLVIESNGSTQNTTNQSVSDHSPASVDEASGEKQKHTYASILRVAKGQSPPTVGPHPSVSSKNLQSTASEWDKNPEPVNQQAVASPNAYERSSTEAAEEVSGAEEEGEIKSVYVRNLPSTVSESEIEEEFKRFGRIRSGGVVIRGRKDLGACYAFVEFEDIVAVHNAVQAATAQVAGRQVNIEERRPNSNIPSRSRRGRGRGTYQSDGSRDRHGSRNFSRVNISGHEGGDREYNRSRGNGFYRPNHRRERGSAGPQVSLRSGQSPQE